MYCIVFDCITNTIKLVLYSIVLVIQSNTIVLLIANKIKYE